MVFFSGIATVEFINQFLQGKDSISHALSSEPGFLENASQLIANKNCFAFVGFFSKTFYVFHHAWNITLALCFTATLHIHFELANLYSLDRCPHFFYTVIIYMVIIFPSPCLQACLFQFQFWTQHKLSKSILNYSAQELHAFVHFDVWPHIASEQPIFRTFSPFLTFPLMFGVPR